MYRGDEHFGTSLDVHDIFKPDVKISPLVYIKYVNRFLCIETEAHVLVVLETSNYLETRYIPFECETVQD